MVYQIAGRIKIRKRICQLYAQPTLLFCPPSSPVHALFPVVQAPHQYAEHYVPGRELLHWRVCADRVNSGSKCCCTDSLAVKKINPRLILHISALFCFFFHWCLS